MPTHYRGCPQLDTRPSPAGMAAPPTVRRPVRVHPHPPPRSLTFGPSPAPPTGGPPGQLGPASRSAGRMLLVPRSVVVHPLHREPRSRSWAVFTHPAGRSAQPLCGHHRMFPQHQRPDDRQAHGAPVAPGHRAHRCFYPGRHPL